MGVIRVAYSEDWDEIQEKILAFNAEYFKIPVNITKAHVWFMQHLESGVVLMSDKGLISGLFISDPVRDWDVLVETNWYDPGRDGLRLLREFIGVGRDRGMAEVRMTTLNTTPPGVITLLGRHGFEEIERSHRLIL